MESGKQAQPTIAQPHRASHLWRSLGLILLSCSSVFGGALPSFAQPIFNTPPISPIEPPTPIAPQPSLPTPDAEIEFDPLGDPVPTTPEVLPLSAPDADRVSGIDFVGNQAFTKDELVLWIHQQVPTIRNLIDVQAVGHAILQLYQNQGYYPPLIKLVTIDSSQVAQLEIQEWGVSDINVRGTQRLNPDYVRLRLALATGSPLNVNQIVEALRLLKTDPLIENFSAELAPGRLPTQAILNIDVREAESFRVSGNLDNNRSPSIGTWQRGVQLTEGNLTGSGDRLNLSYSNTEGSNSFSANYTVPLSPHNTTLGFSYGHSASRVISAPFNVLDIQSSAQYMDWTLRHPLLLTAREEFALGLTLSRWQSESRFLEGLLGKSVPYPSPGSIDGQTRLTTLRFFQEWTQRSESSVIAVRSQLNIGLDALGSTIQTAPPDARYISWQGQAQWVQRIDPNILVLFRGSLQLADRPLVPLEQFAIGGSSTVRGYRRDALIGDNGAFLSAEARIPVLTVPEWDGTLQVAPFIDWGTVWNANGSLSGSQNALAAIGLGLQWQQSDWLTARVDWGIPLTSLRNNGTTLQESGLYFSLVITPF